MEDSGVFHIDTKGICLMCLKDCNLYDYYSPHGGSKKVKQEIGSCTRAASFRMILRYLKINLFTLCNFPPSFLKSMDVMEESDVVIPLCGDCFFLSKSFSKLYENMEEIRLQLDACLQTVHEVMQYGNKQQDRVEEYEKRRRSKNMLEMMTANVAEQLRKETLRKCAIKVDAFVPRVTLHKKNLPATTTPSGLDLAKVPEAPPSKALRSKPGPKCRTEKETNYDDTYNLSLNQLLDKPVTDTYTNNKNVEKRSPSQRKRAYKRTGKYARSSFWKNKAKSHDVKLLGDIDKQSNSTTDNVVNMQPAIKQSDSLEVGYKSRVKPKGQFYPCSECNEIFDMAAHLLKHQQAVHSTVKKAGLTMTGKRKRVRCKFCLKLFMSKPRLMVHMKGHYRRGETSANAVKQASTTKDKKGVNGIRHGRGKQTQSTGSDRCQYCDKWFSSKQVYITHLRAIHSLEMYRHKLPEGTTENQLKSAIWSAFLEHVKYPHDSKKQYGCPYCDTRYPHPSHLRLHIIKKHFDKLIEKILDGEQNNEFVNLGEGEGFQFEFENGEEEQEDDGEHVFWFQSEMIVENESSAQTEGDNPNNDMEEQTGRSYEHGNVIVNDNSQSTAEYSDDGDDFDDQPPILMRETYSLSETDVIEVEQEHPPAPIPMPVEIVINHDKNADTVTTVSS